MAAPLRALLARRAAHAGTRLLAAPFAAQPRAVAHVHLVGVSACRRTFCQPAAEATEPNTVATLANTSTTEVANAAPEDAKQTESRMVRALKINDPDAVLKLYDGFIATNSTPSGGMLECYIEAKAKVSGVQEAMGAMKVLSEQYRDTKMGERAYAALISACAVEKDKDTAAAIYDTMIAAEIKPTHDVFTRLMAVHVACGDFDGADGIFKKMRDLELSPLGATYLAYIYGCMGADDNERAYKMLKLMEAEWRIPTTRAYEHMLKFFGRTRHMDGQLHCIKAIISDKEELSGTEGKRLWFAQDVHKQLNMSLSILMRQAREQNDPAKLMELQNLATKAGADLNVHQQTAVVFSLLKMGDSLQAFEKAVELLRKEDVLPNRAPEWLASSLSKDPAIVDDAYYLLESSKAAGQSVPVDAVNIVIEACAILRDLDRAFATWAELEQLGLAPNTGTYNALLRACIRTREAASGRRLLSRMELDGIPPDSKTYMHRAALLLQARQADAAIGLIAECREAGFSPDPYMYVTIINYLLRGRHFEQARELYDEVREHRVDIPKDAAERIESQLQH